MVIFIGQFMLLDRFSSSVSVFPSCKNTEKSGQSHVFHRDSKKLKYFLSGASQNFELFGFIFYSLSLQKINSFWILADASLSAISFMAKQIFSIWNFFYNVEDFKADFFKKLN